MGMRPLSSITTPIIDKAAGRYHERRSVRSDVFNSLTVLALFKHDENETQLFVSHNDDPLCAVWIKKNPLLMDARFQGRFVVVTLMAQTAREKSLAHFPILDFDRYTPDERKQLQAAIDAAYRARVRNRGMAGQPVSTSGFRGRTTFG